MDTARPTLLLTRPEPASGRFAAAFRQRFGADWPIIVAPLMRTEWLSPEMPADRAQDLVFTSEAAVQGFARLCEKRDLHAWCVGARTAEAARNVGFTATEGSGGARALAQIIADRSPASPVLWSRGEDVAMDIAGFLNRAGIEAIPVVTYAQRPVPPSDEARLLLAGAGPVLLPLFSARSARLAGDAFHDCRAPLLVAALSDAVAVPSQTLAPQKLVVASHPDGESMLDALRQLVSAHEVERGGLAH